MLQRYIINVNDKYIGIRYNETTCICQIGGKNKTKSIVENIIEDYLQVVDYGALKEIQKNKFMFVFKMSNEDFKKGIKNLFDSDFTIVETNSLGQILR